MRIVVGLVGDVRIAAKLAEFFVAFLHAAPRDAGIRASPGAATRQAGGRRGGRIVGFYAIAADSGRDGEAARTPPRAPSGSSASASASACLRRAGGGSFGLDVSAGTFLPRRRASRARAPRGRYSARSRRPSASSSPSSATTAVYSAFSLRETSRSRSCEPAPGAAHSERSCRSRATGTRRVVRDAADGSALADELLRDASRLSACAA